MSTHVILHFKKSETKKWVTATLVCNGYINITESPAVSGSSWQFRAVAASFK